MLPELPVLNISFALLLSLLLSFTLSYSLLCSFSLFPVRLMLFMQGPRPTCFPTNLQEELGSMALRDFNDQLRNYYFNKTPGEFEMSLGGLSQRLIITRRQLFYEQWA